MALFRAMIVFDVIFTILTRSQLYILQQESLTWEASENLCLFNYDTHLASIHGTTDNTDATDTLYTLSGRPTWIGLNHIDTDVEWTWTDDTEWDYGTTFNETPWYPGYGPGRPNPTPGEDCVLVVTAGLWVDWYCTVYQAFSLCGYPQSIPIVNDPVNYIRMPSHNNIIGAVDVLDEIHIEFDIIFSSFPATDKWGSILHIGDSFDQQFPAIYVFEGQYFNSTVSTVSAADNTFNSDNLDSLSLGVLYHYTLHQTQDSMQITVNGAAVYDGYIDSHAIISNRKLYLGNEWNVGESSFDSKVTNLRITTSNSHSPNGFNYNCDGTNRWTVVSGTWLFDDDACTVTQTNGEFDGAVVWLGTADTSSIDWSDYKIEIKFQTHWFADFALDSEVGILVRSQTASATDDGGQQYSFSVILDKENSNGTVQLAIDNDGHTVVTSQVVSVYGDINTLRVEATGATFHVYWHNEFLFTVIDDTFSFGSIGLRTWRAQATFTSVRIRFPSDNHLYLVCPVGSTQVGDINADIEVCGLEACDARYDKATIDDCLMHCMLNTNCKSFRWSPIDGDQNHLSTAVCTIYDTEAATTTLGPNGILCRKNTFNFGNLYNDKDISNAISTQQSKILSNIEITDPLSISFDFIIAENDCTTIQDKICTLIQFGATNKGIFFPRISTKNDNINGLLYWNIQMSDGSTTQNITYNLNETGANNESFAVTTNAKSNFHIIFNGLQRQFYIGAKLFHYSNDISNDFEAIVGDSQPFYVGNPDPEQVSLNANITNLCISTASGSPTTSPTDKPSKAPTVKPTESPTHLINAEEYTKIDCYTEYGEAGERSVSCLKSHFMMVSCGISRSNSTDTEDIIFYKGSYIERVNTNDLTSREICHVDYNIHNPTNNTIRAQARCCNFKQEYNDDFKCRYFKSDDIQLGTGQSSSERAATKSNEFTYTTCPKEFPSLISCATHVDETKVTNFAETIDDIQFYGTVYSTNPEHNLYFELNTGNASRTIPFPPTSSTTSTSHIYSPTKSPTYTPTSSADTLQLNISQTTRCVSQYGPKTGNYTIAAIATCCTAGHSTSQTIVQTTFAPTPSPIKPPLLETALFGSNGTNTGERFKEFHDVNSSIIGIDEWGIFQVDDQRASPVNNIKIKYQGILIGTYKVWNTTHILTTQTLTDYHNIAGNLFHKLDNKPCSSFMLDTDVDGHRDFINGFDVYYTPIAIYGLTFYTSLGRKYSCPDDGDFIDTSVTTHEPTSEPTVEPTNGARNDPTKDPTNDPTKTPTAEPTTSAHTTSVPAPTPYPGYNDLADKWYNMSVVSQRNVFDKQGTYKLSGWTGWYQTRTVQTAVVRNIMGSIAFLFTAEQSINASTASTVSANAAARTRHVSDSLAPSLEPANTTHNPTVSEQSTKEIKCFAIAGVNKVACKRGSVEFMTGCNGYSIDGQVMVTYIDDVTGIEECVVETVNRKTAVAYATCCYFFNAPPRDFNVFIFTSFVGGAIFVSMIVFMWLYLCLVVGNEINFDPKAVDDDTKIDDAIGIEANLAEIISSTVPNFHVGDADHREMLEMQVAISVGLDSS